MGNRIASGYTILYNLENGEDIESQGGRCNRLNERLFEIIEKIRSGLAQMPLLNHGNRELTRISVI